MANDNGIEKCREILIKDCQTGGIVHRIEVEDKTDREITSIGLDLLMSIDSRMYYIERFPNDKITKLKDKEEGRR